METEKDKDLLQAINQGSLNAVIAALESGAELEAPDIHGYPGLPLRTACFHGHKGIVIELLRRGANPNAGNSDGPGAPVRMARRGKQEEIVRVLIENGAYGLTDPGTVPHGADHSPIHLESQPSPGDSCAAFSADPAMRPTPNFDLVGIEALSFAVISDPSPAAPLDVEAADAISPEMTTLAITGLFPEMDIAPASVLPALFGDGDSAPPEKLPVNEAELDRRIQIDEEILDMGLSSLAGSEDPDAERMTEPTKQRLDYPPLEFK